MNKRYALSLIFLLFFVTSVFGQTQPVITSFSPESGIAGTPVTITGLRFSAVLANNMVFFGDVKATVTAATSTSLTVVVPAGASNKAITVTVNRLTGFSSKPFKRTYSSLNGVFTNNTLALKSVVAPVNILNQYNGTIATGDFDDDGKIDLASFNEFGVSVLIYKNTGNSEQPFLAVQNIKITPTVQGGSVATGDLDGDGKLDIVIGSGSNIGIYLNTSTASSFSFASRVSFYARSASTFILTDIDGDGKLDICGTYGGSGITVLRNTSTASTVSFSSVQEISLGGNSSVNSFRAKDIDGDSKLDLIVAFDKKIGVFRNIGASGALSFSQVADLDLGVYPNFDIDDLDGDGKYDLVSLYGKNVKIFKNTSTIGNIAFVTSAISVANEATSFNFGDLNGDGKPEILLTNAQKKIELLPNISINGNIAFKDGEIYYLNDNAGSLSIADWNNDGRLDLGVNHSSSTASIFVNQIDAPSITSFQVNSDNATVNIKGANFTKITAVKFGNVAAVYFKVISETEISATAPANIKGTLSVIGTNGTATVNGFSNIAPPSITSFSPLTGPVGSTITITGKNFSQKITDNVVYFGDVKAVVTAASSTSLTVTVPTGLSYSGISVVTNSLKAISSNFFNVTFGDGTAIFPAADSFKKSNLTLLTASLYIRNRGVIAPDWNGDGKPDLLIGDFGDLEFYSNTGDPIAPYLIKPKLTLKLDNYGRSFFADLNSDGKLDIISSTTSQGIDVYKNTSNTTALSFEKKEIVGLEVNRKLQTYVTNGDLDQDGKLDLLVYGYESIMIFRNSGSVEEISFSKIPMELKCPYYSVNSSYSGFESVQVIDLDGDGKQDIIANCSNKVFMFFKNTSENGIFSFTLQKELNTSDFGVISKFIMADLNGDGLPDISIYKSATSNNTSFLVNTSNNGTISFATSSTTTLISTNNLAFGDLDGDGKPDLVAAYSTKVSMLKNMSTGNAIVFGPSTEIIVGTSLEGISLVDINNDGKLDLAVTDNSAASGNSQKTYVLFNVIKQPALLSAVVTSPGANNTVKLSGSNLSGTHTITVDGTRISNFSVISDTEIIAQFPNQLSGTITISTTYGKADFNGYSSKPIPLIQSFSPISGKINTLVTITGLNFDPTASIILCFLVR